MSLSEKKIELKNESIMLNKIVLDDLNTYKILSDIKEEKREDFIKKAIIIGAIGLRNLYLTENVDYIEKEFKTLLTGLESQSKDIKNNLEKDFRELLKTSEGQSKDMKVLIEKTLDVDNNSSSLGKMRVLFEDYFDKRKGKVSDLLNPFEEESPIKKLKDEIFKKIQELRDELIKEKASGEMREKTTLKGAVFEELVLESIEDICSEYEDKIAPVGDKLGKTNKIGDITVDVSGDVNKRIIIECKDSLAYTHKKTVDEINDGIENRSAKFGIFLFKSQSQIPSALAPMKITNNYIITSFDNYGLYFAFRVARLFVERSAESRQNAIPIGEIQKEIESLNAKLSTFSNIQTKVTQINNASAYIQENIDRLKKDIEEGLGSIKRLIEGKRN